MQPERAALVAGAAALGIDADDAQIDALLGYLGQLEKWNRVHNLTSIRDRGRMVTHHLLDSMTVVAPLRRTLPALRSVLDVGSGGGFPGAVIAILMPGVDVRCVDAVAKKAAFVQQAAAELGLGRLHGVHARVEALRSEAPEAIVSRAFASLEQFVRLTRHLLPPAGVWLAMKGVHPADEIAALAGDIEVFHVEQVHVPGSDLERHLVWMRMGRHAAG